MLEILKNIWLIVISFLGTIWLIYLYLKTLLYERELDEINKRLEEIEKNKFNIDKDLKFSYPNEPKILDNMDNKEIEEVLFDYLAEQEKLSRQKKYILEKINIYKIFKN